MGVNIRIESDKADNRFILSKIGFTFISETIIATRKNKKVIKTIDAQLILAYISAVSGQLAVRYKM
jgi:hypothetical protein